MNRIRDVIGTVIRGTIILVAISIGMLLGQTFIVVLGNLLYEVM